MGGCAGKLNVSDVTRLATLPRQISFARNKTSSPKSDPQVNAKEEGEKVENKVGGNEEKNGGEDKKEAPLVDLSTEGEKSSTDDPKTDAAAVPPGSVTESKVETPVEDNANPSTENKVETPVAEVVDNTTPDEKVETLVNNLSEEKTEAPVSNSEDKAEAAAVVVTEDPKVKQPEAAPVNVPEEPAQEPEVKQPEAAPVNKPQEPTKEPEVKQPEAAPVNKPEEPAKEPEVKQPEAAPVKKPEEPVKEPQVTQPEAAPVNKPQEPAKEPESKNEAVVKEGTEAKQPETAPAKVEDKTDAASVAQ